MKTQKPALNKPRGTLMHLLSHESEGHYCSGPTKLWVQKASQFLQQAHAETEGNPPPPISHRPLKGSHLNPGWRRPKMSISLPVPATRYAWMMRSHDTSGITWSVPQGQGVEETWEKLCAWRPILSAKREQEACIWLAHNYMTGLNSKLEFLSLCGPLNPFKSKLSKCKCHFEINTCFMLAEIHRGKIFQLCRKTNRNPLWGGN